MSHPSDPYLGNVPHVPHVLSGMLNFIDNCGINAIEQAGKDRFSGVPYDLEHDRRNPETDDRISLRKAKPYPGNSDSYSKTGEAVHSSVLTICNQGSASDFSACTNSDQRRSFVPKESEDRSDCHNAFLPSTEPDRWIRESGLDPHGLGSSSMYSHRASGLSSTSPHSKWRSHGRPYTINRYWSTTLSPALPVQRTAPG